MRVLVVHPPVAVAPDFVDYPYFSDLGAVQLAGVLRERHDLVLLDAFAVPGAGVHRRGERTLLGVAPGALLARAPGTFDSAVVALTPFHRPPDRDDLVAETLAGARALTRGGPVVLADCYQSGQHYIETEGEAILRAYPEADAWVKYEAEATVPALLERIARGERPRGSHAGQEVDLDGLPEPAWDLADLGAHDAFLAEVATRLGRAGWPFRIDGRTLPAVTSRGCPFDCVHCSSNPGRAAGAPKAQRRLSPDRVAARLGALVRHGATRVSLLDEALNVRPAHLAAVLDAADALGLALEVPNGLRADLLRDEELARLRGRITTLSVSAESGVQRVVDDVVGKRLDLAAVTRVAARCQQLRLPLLVHFIIGLPGETAADVNGTLAYAAELHERHGATPSVQYAVPLAGTRLAERAGVALRGDVGPAFQVRPSATNAALPPDVLARFRWAFDRRVGAAPDKLILNLTYRCNNHCAFCAVGNRVPRDGDPGAQHRILEDHRRRGVRLVDFDGGEPTLHPELVPLVRHAAALGYERIAVTTNGRLCSYPAFASRLATSGVTTLLVSLHGPDRDTHGALTGVPEAFDQTTAGIANLVAAAPPGVELGMNTTVVRGNVRRLAEIAALAHRLGLRWLNVQLLTPFGRATRDQAPSEEEASAALRALVDAWSTRLRLGIVNLPLCLLPGHGDIVAPDLGKLGRQMVFVNDEEVNLGAYLAVRRVRREGCAPCPYASCCAGFFELGDAPEPPWAGGAARGALPRA